MSHYCIGVGEKCLGMTYVALRKSYYCDHHDRADVLLYRKKYLEAEAALELQQYVWVQLDMEQAAALKLDLGKLFDIGMAVVVEEGAVVEVHVDCLPVQMRNEYSHVMPNGLHMGGMLSVRKPPGTLPLIKAGQDETVFKMYQQGQKQWRNQLLALLLAPNCLQQRAPHIL